MPNRSESTRDKETSRYDVNRTLSTYQPNKPTTKNERTSPAPLVKKQRPGQDNVAVKDKKRIGFKRMLLILVALVLVFVTVIGIWDYKNASDATQKMFGSSPLGALVPSRLKTTEGRTNILVVGYSADDPGHAGALLTDSLMIISLDKSKKSGYMLSIPRDLYVSVPNYGYAKINEAYQAGESQGFTESDYPNGGIGLLQKIITTNLDLQIHYSVVVNYAAVRDLTNALGGITVTIDSSDPRGIYDPNFKPEEGGPLTLSNGPQQLDGQTALRLTRARGSTAGSYGFPLSDFNRTQNQQKVFAGIRSKLSVSALLDPRRNKPIFDATADNLTTSLKIHEVLPLLRAFNAVPDSSMRQVSLRDVDGVNLLTGYTTRAGQAALVPAAGVDDYSEIIAVLNQMN